MVHDPTTIMPHPPMLPDVIATRPHPHATSPIDIEMPQHVVV